MGMLSGLPASAAPRDTASRRIAFLALLGHAHTSRPNLAPGLTARGAKYARNMTRYSLIFRLYYETASGRLEPAAGLRNSGR